MAQPTTFSVNMSDWESQGRVRVQWVYAASAGHYSYRVYRLGPEDELPTLIYETTGSTTTTFYDYYAPVGTVGYSVVEVTEAASVQTEETRAWKFVALPAGFYWLLHPTDNTKHIILRNVVSDEFKTEREFEVKNLLGRGRKIDVGDNWGKTGSLEARIYDRPDRTARQQRLDIEAAKDGNLHWFLRTPFGDVWKIWFEDPDFSRIAGTGASEHVDMSMTYYEVA